MRLGAYQPCALRITAWHDFCQTEGTGGGGGKNASAQGQWRCPWKVLAIFDHTYKGSGAVGWRASDRGLTLCRCRGRVVVMKLEDFVEIGDVLRSGVYALSAKGVVIYVGKSKAMIARINAHRRAWIDKRKGASWLTESLGIPGLRFDAIHIRPCPLDSLDRLEREMIDKYKPRYNVQLQTNRPIAAPIKLSIKGVTVVLNAAVAKSTTPLVERRI